MGAAIHVAAGSGRRPVWSAGVSESLLLVAMTSRLLGYREPVSTGDDPAEFGGVVQSPTGRKICTENPVLVNSVPESGMAGREQGSAVVKPDSISHRV